ncbi:FAD/FMN-containing dehydrogenase [Kitasatospora sp. MAP12-15]|uniref:cholesterol oxidase substrate-binding domain-containing protein n=1 Tax=unclassified Kitasatospora TaxID=2633591 RepID=UPI0024769871|nr:cholesterol oxidase substrate-binding domain-containing protein [Kitasatospora sp. MAP12-44]MDH6114894.1 FAD/FMN-containing dehydrogenase [Kitasatospora sp. MAP12-44]
MAVRRSPGRVSPEGGDAMGGAVGDARGDAAQDVADASGGGSLGGAAGLTRRRLLAGSAALGGGVWLLRGMVGPDTASADAASGAVPPAFPAGIELYQRVFENWAGEIHTDQLWTCAPRTPQDVVTLANWANAQGWRLRAQGYRHTWAPLTVADGTPSSTAVLLLDTTRYLTAVGLATEPGGLPAVRAQAGAGMEQVLAFLAGQGLGVTSCPAPGDVTVGGVLAIGGHGTAVPAAGESPLPGHGYGSVSNLVTELTAVVWDEGAGQYVLRTFQRSEADSAAFLVHLGRAFVTEAVLRAGADQNLRCVSRLDIPASELFAAPGASSSSRRFADFLERDGRVEAIWFAFTEYPWLKSWSVTPEQPFSSRAVDQPYNYPFSDSIPTPVADLAGQLVGGSWALAPVFGQLQFLIARLGLTGDLTDVLLSGGLLRDLLTLDVITHLLADGLGSDLWGPSRTLLQYVRPTTLRMTANGYAVLAKRADVQWVVNQVTSGYQQLLTEYQGRGAFPINGAVEIRVTGLDDPAVVGVPGARAPLLSALSPRPDHPEWDVAVWFDVLTLPSTPGLHQFGRDLEQFLLTTFDGTRAALRVEWSKGWAYTADATWADQDVITRVIPDSHRAGGGPGWDEAVATLNRYDPHHVFSTPFLDTLLR